jgi:hypothetical protein
MALRLPQQPDTTKQIEEAGFDTLPYDVAFKQYRIKIDPALVEKQKAVLLSLIRQAWEGFGKG